MSIYNIDVWYNMPESSGLSCIRVKMTPEALAYSAYDLRTGGVADVSSDLVAKLLREAIEKKEQTYEDRIIMRFLLLVEEAAGSKAS